MIREFSCGLSRLGVDGSDLLLMSRTPPRGGLFPPEPKNRTRPPDFGNKSAPGRVSSCRTRMDSSSVQFEQLMLPHLDSAYRLARWIVRNEHDAQDQVQEAYLRAFRFFPQFRGGDGRAWLLTIVRNVCFSWLRKNRIDDLAEPFDDEIHVKESSASVDEHARRDDAELLSQALEKMPALFREVIVLRELEGLSYKEIAAVAEVPIGTIMSRLARARRQLQAEVARQLNPSSDHEM